MSSEPASPHEYGDDISTSSLSSSEDEGSGGYVCSQSDQSEDISSDDSIEESPRPRAKKRKTGSGGKKASRNTKKKNSAATRKPSASLTLSRKARRRIPTSPPDSECSDTQDGSGPSSSPRTLQLAPRSSRVTGHNASVPPARAPHLSTPSAPTRRGDSSRMPPAGSPDSVVQLISTHVDLHALSENSQARSSISGADQNNAADEGASTSTRLATPATMPSSSFPANCTYACIQHCPAASSVTSITTPRAHVAPSEAEPEVPWSLVKSRFPWMDTDPQTGRMVLEAGASTFDPSDLFLVVDPACAIRPAKWQYLVDVYTGEVEAEDGESCVDRYVMAFRDRTVWTLARGAWISAVMMSHPYPRPVILALSQVMEWCLELRGAKKWSSIMRFMFHQHRALLEEDGEVIGRRWDPHDWYTSPLYALHLGSAANRGHCTPHVLQHGHERNGDEDTASEDEEAEPCRIWNVRSNGCSDAAHGEDTAARHVCLTCKGQHRVVDREACRQKALERRLID